MKSLFPGHHIRLSQALLAYAAHLLPQPSWPLTIMLRLTRASRASAVVSEEADTKSQGEGKYIK